MKTSQFKVEMYRLAIILLLIVPLFIFCKDVKHKESKSTKSNKMIEKTGFPFNLDKPDKVIKLEQILQEISSISFYKDSQLICIHDERPDLFVLDTKTGQIIEHIKANETGDYEGIELVGKDLYILKSSGTLTEYQDFKQSSTVVLKYNTELSSQNNTEGLGYDPKTNSLLIACKEYPFISKSNKSYENVRCVYQFDLVKKTLNEKPFITINLNLLSEKYGIEQFMPSGIAVHPVTGEFYIISAVGNILMVVNRNNEIVHLEKLIPKLYKQPEGICFSPDGKTLYISNEGKQKQANILIFNSI